MVQSLLANYKKKTLAHCFVFINIVIAIHCCFGGALTLQRALEESRSTEGGVIYEGHIVFYVRM